MLTAAKESRDSIIVYFLTNTNFQPHVDYLLQTDEDGNSLLHCMSSDITAEPMFDHLTTKQQKELICQRNNSGDTILHSALKNWKDRHWVFGRAKPSVKTMIYFCISYGMINFSHSLSSFYNLMQVETRHCIFV